MSLSYPEAIVIGALQGVAELFPVSSLGHSILIPALIGGHWAKDLDVTADKSPYLSFVVGLHVATALALLLFFWRDWVRIIGGLISSIRYRRIQDPDERLAWLLIAATIPVGLAGLALDHTFRTLLGKPTPAALFLTLNGLVIFAGERLRRSNGRAAPARAHGDPTPTVPDLPAYGRAPHPQQSHVRPGSGGRHRPQGAYTIAPQEQAVAASVGHIDADANRASDQRIARTGFLPGILIGAAQILALAPGISRSGVTMIAGLVKGLSHEDAARFAFLLATPVILAAGLLKLPDLAGPMGNGIHGQVLVGSLLSFAGAYVSVRFLTRYFETRTLTPFAVYCALFGIGSLVYLNV